MRSIVAITLLTALLSSEANAATRRRAASAPVDPDAITISFTPTDGIRTMTWTALDVGTLARRERARGARVVRNVAVGVDRVSGVTGGTATLRAHLQFSDGRAIVRIDGITLGAAQIVIDPHAPIGSAIVHHIEIEVPASVPAGEVASAIRWEVSTN
ncbi:MAG: hypothetical protein QOI24_3662 [Acidobacteriota bacterium]|jgi:phosphatidylethanolamine-binding protein (PEBP) family uncharacterized protein|nr:hypothetical protein [Acidobacteriota bacterium]